MNLPYRTRRILRRVGITLGVVLAVTLVVWMCWVVWLQRYVVYTDDGVRLDFEYSSYGIAGQVAEPPKAEQNVSIFFNEGADAIDTVNEMTQLNGYYITNEMCKNDLEQVKTWVERLPSGTPVMIDMKGPYGSFFYKSNLGDSIVSASTNIDAVSTLVQRMRAKGLYTIAKVSAFRDYNFGLNHVSSGLYMLSRIGLWPDSENMYWLDPTNPTTTSWVTSVVVELRDMGFNEVLLTDFCFPDSNQYIFDGNKELAIQEAAVKINDAVASDTFTLGFAVNTPAFPLPEGRCRLYVSGVDPSQVEARAAASGLEDPTVQMVFLSETADSRYDKYGVLRSIMVSEEVEARKGNA